MPDLKHIFRNLTLILFSLYILPANTYFILLSYLYSFLVNDTYDERLKNRLDPKFRPCTVLVTGVGMTKGLTLARIFYRAGYNVIGADFEPNGTLSPGRLSRALKFYRLEHPSAKEYSQKLLEIVVREKITLWVSCSGVASALEDAQAKEIIERETTCKAIQFGVKLTQTFHEKHTFIDYIKRVTDLETPITHTISSHLAAEKILHNAPSDKRFIMKPIGMIDAVRGDMTLLPRATPEDTVRHLSKLPISEDFPWILQEFIDGSEYCTHSVIVHGKIRAFVACPSSELLMHYEALLMESDLAKAMLAFTTEVAKTTGKDFNGHLSFDFLVPEESLRLIPIECNPRAHTAVVLFDDTCLAGVCRLAMQTENEAKYTRDPKSVDSIVSAGTGRFYWIGNDVFTLLVLPTFSFLRFKLSIAELLHGYKTFYIHLSSWKDGTYEIWDPLPFWILYQVYWPVQFFHCLKTGKRWSRINFSTLKMFEC